MAGDLEGFSMEIEKNDRAENAKAAPIAVSESAKQQIATKASETKGPSSSTRMGPSFMDGFQDGPT